MAAFNSDLMVYVDPRKRSSVLVDRARLSAGPSLSSCAGVALDNLCTGEALGAVSVYLVRVRGEGAVPAVSWELRARYGGDESEVIASGVLSKFSAWSSAGSIVHASGRRALGFELWASHDGTTMHIPCEVRFVVAPACVGLAFYSEPGGLV